DGWLISTDVPYVGRHNEPYVGCVVPEHLRSKWTLIRRPDRDALPGARTRVGTIDLCHYDSDKSYDGRAWAYRLLWQHLRPGGILISDDVQDNRAFRDFVEEVGIQPVVVARQASSTIAFSGAVMKPAVD